MENLPEALIFDIIKRLTSASDRNSVSLLSKQLCKIEAHQRRSIRVGRGFNPVTQALTKICLCFPNLTKIEINYSGWESNLGKQLDDQGLFIISTNCPSLADLTLIDCSFITDLCLSHLASCKKLVNLSIVKCRSIKEHSLVKLGNCLRILERLEFEVHDFDFDFGGIIPNLDGGWLRPQLCCERLKEFKLVTSSFGLGRDLSFILGSCGLLEKVRLHECIGIDDSGIISISEKNHFLKSISLNLSDFSELTDASLKALGNNCPFLENVELVFPDPCEFLYEHSSITIEGILALIKGCSIRVLVLNNIQFLNDSVMKALSLASPCLETLEIGRNHEVTNLGIGCMINFSRLVNLKICRCSSVSDYGLKPLTEMKKLDYLEVKECPNISEAACQGAAKKVCYKRDYW